MIARRSCFAGAAAWLICTRAWPQISPQQKRATLLTTAGIVSTAMRDVSARCDEGGQEFEVPSNSRPPSASRLVCRWSRGELQVGCCRRRR